MILVFFILFVGIVFLLILLFSNSSQKLSSEEQLCKAKSIIQQSNDNLDKYLKFIEEHKNEYGMPIKSIGVKSMKYLCLIDENDKINSKISLYSFCNIPVDYIEQKWAQREAYMKIKLFPTLDNIILVYDNAKKLVLKGKMYDFESILSYQVTDNSTQIVSGGLATSTTKTDIGSMVGRALVGGAIGGGVGAIIGANSASKTTTTEFAKQQIKTTHHYCLYISVNDIASPIIKYDFGSNENLVNECIAIINIIVNNKN